MIMMFIIIIIILCARGDAQFFFSVMLGTATASLLYVYFC